ncbi:hypothetical protein Misp01_57240 [Microtetraspora sp. NBRC 13810]|uniref:hypothetical protein n=1 Tax=Microtetraspora sp. NBRC 13810 TaxID=3030990 RepID=UPI0024A529C1|nr:hypothetical protein [Microtetraspora sp. NBRC 13810]GLW10596.1 hypothetical protein Misp01_57240 [Microtetraspora sp. NBRC 13810]
MISVYIDLAIGLVLAFLMLSLLVSGINEGIVRLLSIRSKFLWAYLRDTLDGGPEEGRSWIPSRIADVFARLPFAADPRPLHDPEPAPAVVTPMPEAPVAEGRAPVAAAVDLTRRLYDRLREIDHPKGNRTSIATIPPTRFGVAVMEMVSAEDGGVEGFLRKLEELRSPLSGHLGGVWRSAAGDLEAFRKGTEVWFDGEMQRLTMLYRRYVRWAVAALGLVVVLVFGMDSLEYAKTLLRDNGYRAGVAAIAGGGDDGLAALRDRCTAGGETAEPYACVTESFSSPALTRIFDHSLVSMRMPEQGDPVLSWNAGAWWDRLLTLGHWPGFLLSYVAVLFGAPFWWDLLRRLTGLRKRG